MTHQLSLTDWTPPTAAPRASTQGQQIVRVESRLAQAIIGWAREHVGEEFHLATMTEAITGHHQAAAGREDWRTPEEVVALVRSLWGGRIDLDPCAPPGPRHVIAKVNLAGPTGSPACGLARAWSGHVYVNPPFGDLAEWCSKARHEHESHGAEVVLLLPARTDTAYWHDHVATADAVCLWRGRMRFIGAPASAPFPTALVYWGPRPWVFHQVFSPRGMVISP